MARVDSILTLAAATSEGEWQNKMLSLAGECGFERALFALIPNKHTDFSRAFVRSNYPVAWWEQYHAAGLARIDPTVAHCTRNVSPLVWMEDTFVAPRERELYEEASSYGLACGISLPIHGPLGHMGVLCAVTDVTPSKRALRELTYWLPSLALLRDVAFESGVKFLGGSDARSPQASLTPKELECLKWMMVGKTSWETGRILSVSESTINFHVANIRRKFNVTTRRQALVKAISLGLLTPD